MYRTATLKTMSLKGNKVAKGEVNPQLLVSRLLGIGLRRLCKLGILQLLLEHTFHH